MGKRGKKSLGFIEPETPDAEPTIYEMFAELPLITLVELALLALAIGSGVVALALNRRRG